MYLMLQQDQGDDYVIATGETHSISELLDAAFSVVGISDWARRVELDPAFARPSEVDVLVGDASKANSILGWKPKVSFLELVEMMVQHDIARQAAAA
jgi:GDPmannose 4,6-dehydratase